MEKKKSNLKEPSRKKRRFDPAVAKSNASQFASLRDDLVDAYLQFVSLTAKVIEHARCDEIMM